MSTSRNRIIYQSQALFIAPNSTGFQLQSGSPESADKHGQLIPSAIGNAGWTGITGFTQPIAAGGVVRSLLTPIERVQSANFNFSINRQDINEFGKLARIDSLVVDAPTVGLDFNYYLTDGGNERKMGFNVPTSAAGRASVSTDAYNSGDLCMSGFSALSGLIDDSQGNNYYIIVSKEGTDVHGDTVTATSGDFSVVSIGNGFISDYSIECAVGSLPTASVSVEAFNIKVDEVVSGDYVGGTYPYAPYVPAVDTLNGLYHTGTPNPAVNQFALGGTLNTTGYAPDISAIRPGDLTLTISNAENHQGLIDLAGDGKAHIQSFSIGIPMSRTVLQRLGNTFGYARVIDLPLTMDISVSAVVSELKKNNLFTQLCENAEVDFTLDLHQFDCATNSLGDNRLSFSVKKARLDSETFSNAIGDNQTADLTFSCQVGGANDTGNGIFMSGSYRLWNTLAFFPLGSLKDPAASYNYP